MGGHAHGRGRCVAGWFEEWCEALIPASGCVVIFTDTYRRKVQAHSPLRLEAKCLQQRLKIDPSFKLYVRSCRARTPCIRPARPHMVHALTGLWMPQVLDPSMGPHRARC